MSKRKSPKAKEHVTFVLDCGDYFKVVNTRKPNKVEIIAKPPVLDSRVLLPEVGL